ncbi:unnamed protein product [Porites evermanni]|uniref:Insulin-like domain-containing protein n=1 Tax=Porites evermanni TaxID=104178 RepID=A0ABN8LCZ7_9CNID|nr:unnamed protein product [Porites evermanni]
MQLSVFSICIAVLLSLVTIKVSCRAPEEKKKLKMLPHLCGVEFRKAWEICCDHGCRHNAYKRVLGVAISAEKASDFLERSWKSRHSITRRTADINAVEECCKEGCLLEEVSEYPCDL